MLVVRYIQEKKISSTDTKIQEHWIIQNCALEDPNQTKTSSSCCELVHVSAYILNYSEFFNLFTNVRYINRPPSTESVFKMSCIVTNYGMKKSLCIFSASEKPMFSLACIMHAKWGTVLWRENKQPCMHSKAEDLLVMTCSHTRLKFCSLFYYYPQFQVIILLTFMMFSKRRSSFTLNCCISPAGNFCFSWVFFHSLPLTIPLLILHIVKLSRVREPK